MIQGANLKKSLTSKKSMVFQPEKVISNFSDLEPKQYFYNIRKGDSSRIPLLLGSFLFSKPKYRDLRTVDSSVSYVGGQSVRKE